MANRPSAALRRQLAGAQFHVLPHVPGYVGGAHLEATLTGVTIGQEVVRAGAVYRWTDLQGRVHRRAIIATEARRSHRRLVIWREARLDG